MSDEFREELKALSITELIALAMGQGPADLRDPFPPEEEETEDEEPSDD